MIEIRASRGGICGILESQPLPPPAALCGGLASGWEYAQGGGGGPTDGPAGRASLGRQAQPGNDRQVRE